MQSLKNNTYKALMIDVDGTLVENSAKSKVSKRVIQAIDMASEKIHIGLATSRPFFMVKDIFSQLKLSGPSIINGGAQVIDAGTHQFYAEQFMLQKDAAYVFETIRKTGKKFFVTDDKDDHVSPKTYTPKKPIQIFVVGLLQNQADMLLSEFSKIPTLVTLEVPDWKPGKIALLISHAKATKQHGIFEVAKLLNINTHEIIGVGDGNNDFPLLMACGLKVAMGNAVPGLKAIADYIAPTVTEDGVADVIEKFVL